MRRSILSLVLLITIFMPMGLGNAQTPDACQSAVEAAQAAFDNGDFATAVTTATTAETACVNNVLKYRDAQSLHFRAQQQLDLVERQTFIENAKPGMVDLGDYSLFMQCEGAANDLPTIILENGFEQSFETWDEIFPALTTVTQVCRYNRLGVHPSDPAPEDASRTSFEQAEDLHALLTEAEIEAPYIFAGHSIAGLMLYSFPHLYPDEVVGMVFVDAVHPQDIYENFLAEVDNPDEPQGNEHINMQTIYEEMNNEEVLNLDPRPVYILTATQGLGEVDLERWLRNQALHLDSSTHAEQVILEASAHFIQTDEPDAVVEALLWVLSEITGETITLPEE